MQRDDGSFESHFVVAEHGNHALDDPQAPGLALYALARARPLVKDGRIGPALERGFEAARAWLATVEPRDGGCIRLLGRVPWLTFAALEADSALVAQGVLPGQLATTCLVTPDRALEPDLAGGHVTDPGRVPGAADVLAAAASAAACGGACPGEPAASLGLDLARRLVVTAGLNDHFMPVPSKALGGVGGDLVDSRQTAGGAHAVIALLAGIVPRR
jgi:hypothetical protein